MIGIFINLWNRLTGGGTPAPTPALLDTYGGAAAAFSLRKLSSTYGGAAVRVRRSLDNTEQDIQFAGGQLDQAALQAFVGYENLFAYSEQFENASWTKNTSTITPNAGADPLGGNNAERWLSNVGSTTHYLSQNIALTSGQSYTISFYVKSNTGSDQQFRLFGSGGTTLVSQNLTANSSWQRFTYTFVADTATAIAQGISRPSTNTAVDLLIFGAQLNQGVTAQNYQQTTASANTANGFVTKWYTQDGNGENLLLQSQTFDAAYWSKATTGVAVSSNTTTAPDGTLTADSITETAENRDHYFANLTGLTLTNQSYTLSCYLKANQRTWAALSMYNGTDSLYAWFDLQNGVVGTVQSGATATIQNAGNGWYRCSMTRTMSSSSINFVGINTTTTNNVVTYLGVAGSGIYAWGAQLSQSSWLQGYQATTTTAVSRRDASQATAASQPRIVNAGVIERENGKPAVYFNGVSGTELKTAYNVPTDASTFLATFRRHAKTGVNIEGIFNGDGGSGGIGYYNFSPNAIQLDGAGAGGTNTASLTNNLLAHYIMSGLYTGSTTSGTSLFANGYYTNIFTGTGVTRTAPNPLAIGGRTGGGQTTWVMKGTFQEGVLYNSNMLSSITAMNLNQNSYYQVYWQGTQQALLDQFGGSAAAFSLRNLSSSYRGPLVRVRRSSDNAETDIGGTFSGDLDVNSLLAFTGGQNLALYSQDFENPYWIKVGSAVPSNTTIAPDGTLTADKLNETAVNSGHVMYSGDINAPSPSQYTVSAYIKAAERSKAFIVWYYAAGIFDSVYAYIDLSNGSVYQTGVQGSATIISASVQSVGNGWYRCSVSGNTNKIGTHRVQIETINDSWQRGYLGVAGSGVYVWGAQLTTGSVLQPYIPTTTAAINGANAFVTKWYDQSGIGDNLLLQSQTFENASWVKSASTVSANTITAPDGTLTGETIFETAATDLHYIYQTNTTSAGVYTLSLYIKYLNRKYILLGLNDSTASGAGVVFDIETSAFVGNSTIGSGYSLLSYSITNLLDGWSRYSVTVSTSGAALGILQLRNSNSLAWLNSYTGNTSTGVYIWGGQLSLSSQLLRYQPTTTAIAPKRDAIQATAASQPRIVNAGSVESENGKPALFWTDGSGMRLVSTFSPINSPQSFFAVSKLAAVSGIGAATLFDSYEPIQNVYYFTGTTETPNNKFVYVVNSTNQLTVSQDPIPTQDLVSVIRDTTSYIYDNGVLSVSGALPAGTLSGLSIGGLRGNPTPIVAGYDWFGSIQELTVYPTNQSLRTSVQSNINTYYQIYWQGNGTALLDSFSGASAAYSLRNLSSAYTGPLIRVRRSSDNAERDIYGTFRGDLDLAALTSFVGANSGFVTTWYDQSGTGRHATQATASRQPRIVNAGAVDTLNGKPVIDFATTQDIGFATPLNFSEVDSSFFMTIRRSTAGNDSVLISSVSNDYLWLNYGGTQYYGGTTVINTNLSAANQYMIAAATMDYGVALKWYRNGVLETTKTTGFVGGQAFNTILFTTYRASVVQTSELIVFPTNQDSSAVNIQSNINNYYKIY